jgi:ATP-dependent Clp protease protease subunit
MLHQPWGGLSGQASDIDIHAREILRLRSITNRILAKHTKKNIETLEQDTSRDHFMDAAEAKAYGIIDEIMDRNPLSAVTAA